MGCRVYKRGREERGHFPCIIHAPILVPLSPSPFVYLKKLFLNLFLIGGELLYNVVLVSAVQQCESAISIHISPPSYPPTHTSRLSQSPWLSFLCYTTTIQLSILQMVIYAFQCYSLNLSRPLLSLLCPQVYFLGLHLYSCPANRFISTIFLDFIYIH